MTLAGLPRGRLLGARDRLGLREATVPRPRSYRRDRLLVGRFDRHRLPAPHCRRRQPRRRARRGSWRPRRAPGLWVAEGHDVLVTDGARRWRLTVDEVAGD